MSTFKNVEVSEILWGIGIEAEGIEIRQSTDDDDLWVQVVSTTIGPEANGRKWRISKHATKSEVVQTVFKAYLTWVEHEARENFRWRGQAIFSPHFDVDQLAVLARSGNAHDARSAP